MQTKTNLCWEWWNMPLISVFQRQRQVDLYDTEANLVYIRSSRRALTTQ